MNVMVRDTFNDSNEALAIFSDYDVELIKHGYNRSVYKLTSPNGDCFVAKVGSKTKDHGSTNLNDVRVQDFLNDSGIDFVPEIIYWDASSDIYVERCVGDLGVKFSDLDKKDLDLFSKQLTQIHSIPPADYQNFCAKKGFDIPPIVTPLDSLQTFGFERFEIVKSLCPDPEIINWLDSALKHNLVLVKKEPMDQPHLKWGDIGENLRKSDSKLYFIDWEYSGIGYGSELSYIHAHSHLSDENFDYLVSRYSHHSGRTLKELRDEIKRLEQINRVGDVVWVAMKWGQAKSDSDRNKYEKLTRKRLRTAEKILEKSSS
jgi:hypothetical protein